VFRAEFKLFNSFPLQFFLLLFFKIAPNGAFFKKKKAPRLLRKFRLLVCGCFLFIGRQKAFGV
jgi:hypothetical protein